MVAVIDAVVHYVSLCLDPADYSRAFCVPDNLVALKAPDDLSQHVAIR